LGASSWSDATGGEASRLAPHRGPPEDCGGPWGSGELLQLPADPNLEDPLGRREWVGPNFDPAHFNVNEATEAKRSGIAGASGPAGRTVGLDTR